MKFQLFIIYFQNLLIKPQIFRRASNIQIRLRNIQTVRQIRPIRTHNIDTTRHDIVANSCTRAGKCCNLRLVLLAGLAVEVLENYVSDGEGRRVLQAESQIGLAVALINFDGVVYVVDVHGVVSDVLYSA